MPDTVAYRWKRGSHGKSCCFKIPDIRRRAASEMTESLIRYWATRTEDYHTPHIMPNAKLLSMIEDSFALALSARQATMIENLYFSAHQGVFSDVQGNAVADPFVLLDFNT